MLEVIWKDFQPTLLETFVLETFFFFFLFSLVFISECWEWHFYTTVCELHLLLRSSGIGNGEVFIELNIQWSRNYKRGNWGWSASLLDVTFKATLRLWHDKVICFYEWPSDKNINYSIIRLNCIFGSYDVVL